MDDKRENLVTECCGAFMDVGAVIAEEDAVLTLTYDAASQAEAEAEFSAVAEKAKSRFADVKAQAKWSESEKRLTGTLAFSCAAERLIFEMNPD
ncbi:DUF406 family protein [Ferrimonas gelatinilytica]|uniref:DUF406 family protein n=1 Tax=Ferrimonas gelatinilytica TaxID=1255257 RepID=A0ABP9RWW7_9GAMM